MENLVLFFRKDRTETDNSTDMQLSAKATKTGLIKHFQKYWCIAMNKDSERIAQFIVFAVTVYEVKEEKSH